MKFWAIDFEFKMAKAKLRAILHLYPQTQGVPCRSNLLVKKRLRLYPLKESPFHKPDPDNTGVGKEDNT